MPKNLVETPVEWLSEKVVWDDVNDPSFTYKRVDFYSAFRFKNIVASVGEYVLVSNADAAEPDSEEGCDAAQILKLYESYDMDLEDRYRARVQWFSKPADLPRSSNSDNIQFHENELLEDERPFDTDVSIETFFRKCNIIRGSTHLDPHEILLQNDSSHLTFVCRYKLIQLARNKYSIEPVLVEERMALQLLKTPASKKNSLKPKTPGSITRRLSRVSISEQRDWSVANSEGTKLLLKKAILTDNLNKEKETPRKNNISTPSKKEKETPTKNTIEKKIETPKTEARRKKILLGDEISNMLSMELEERSDEELPILIIRKHEPPCTPKRKTSLSISSIKRMEVDKTTCETPSGRSTRSTRKSICYNELSPKKTTRKALQETPTRTVRKRLMSESEDEFKATTQTPTTPSRRISVATPSRKISTAITPKRTPRKIVSQLTPSLKRRANPIEENEDWDKENSELPGREVQLEEILSFVRVRLLDKTSGCMYISGVPGTGKTATVCAALKRLQDEPSLPSFTLLEVNGMKIAEPRQAYVHIYKQLTGKTVAWEQACSLLEKRFTQVGPRRTPTVLLVDELDALCTRRQDVVYSIMEWATRSTAQLTVLAVANTMDLPERVLAARVASRLGLTRLTFPPYTHTQLQRIVSIRLRDADLTSDAVQLIARKVAAVSGDARRALSLCTRAAQLGAQEGRGAGLREVEAALAEACASATVRAIRALCPAERLMLRAVAAEVERTGSDETTLSRALETAAALVAVEGRGYRAARNVRPPTTSQALASCARLASSRLLLLEPKAAEPRLLLNISADDVHYATRQIAA